MARKNKKQNANQQSANLISSVQLPQSEAMGQPYNTYEHNTGVKSFKVDSWRSYRSDTVNLQTLSGGYSTLNATANAFVPYNAAQQSCHPSSLAYQPLRISSDRTEKAAAGIGEASRRNYSTGFTSRYPTRSTIGSHDEPLPSIEDSANYDPHPFLEAVRQIQDQYQPQDLKVRKVKSTKAQTTSSYRARTPQQTASPPPPQITDVYLTEASKPPNRLPQPQKLLVILDLNGTLLFRRKASTQVTPLMRPGVTPLLEYLFSNHAVMVYTSAMPDSASRMLNFFLHPTQRNNLVAVWARDKLDLNPDQFFSKVQVYKKLDKVWNDEAIQKTAVPGRKWDQSNTVLIDDSKLKALAQPYNLLQVPEYTRQDLPELGKTQKKKQKEALNQIQIDIMKGVELKLEELKYQDNVSRLIRTWRTGEAAIPRLPGEKVVIEDSVNDDKPSQESCLELVDNDEGSYRIQHRTDHLPTPQSMADSDDIGVQSLSVSDNVDNDDGGVATRSSVNRSESPINEVVFKELLQGGGK